MPPLISEDDIRPQEAASSEVQTPLTPSASDAMPADNENPSVQNKYDMLANQLAELKNDTLNLRTSLERQRHTTRKQLVSFAGFILALLLAHFFYLNTELARPELRTPPSSLPDQSQAKLQEEIKILHEALDQLRTSLSQSKSENSKIDNPKPEKPSHICRNLPPNAETETTDYQIRFEAGSSKPLAESSDMLDAAVRQLSTLNDRCILIEGHTDTSGKETKNIDLSRQRAEVVASAIGKKGGIDPNRLLTAALGSSAPIQGLESNDARNRRVTIKIIKQ